MRRILVPVLAVAAVLAGIGVATSMSASLPGEAVTLAAEATPGSISVSGTKITRRATPTPMPSPTATTAPPPTPTAAAPTAMTPMPFSVVQVEPRTAPLRPPPGAANRPFNIDTDNAVFFVAIPTVGLQWLQHELNPRFGDVSLAFRYISLLLNASFDAVAPYDETAVGIYSRIERRPESERPASEGGTATLRNPNIAMIYAMYRSALGFAPHARETWRGMLTNAGLDPDDTSGLDLPCTTDQATTPQAIGNLAAKCMLDGRRNDGMNQWGAMPFADTTGYMPVNTAYELSDPSRWQPLITGNGNGVYRVQTYVTPQWANVSTYSGIDPRTVRIGPPMASDHMNMEAYKAQADAVLEASANLTSYQKAVAEFFDNKARDILLMPLDKRTKNVIDFVQFDFLLHMAAMDAGVFTWQEKTRYDAVRPVTAIHYIYGDQEVTGWGGPGMGATKMPGNQWRSYLPSSDHPEYPSATTCLCSAYAQAARLFTGKDEIGMFPIGPDGQEVPGFSGMLPPISSVEGQREPIMLQFDSWTEFVNLCAQSRVWAGVHFPAAVDVAKEACSVFGDEAYKYFQTLMDGTAPLRGPERPMAPDPMLKEPHWTRR